MFGKIVRYMLGLKCPPAPLPGHPDRAGSDKDLHALVGDLEIVTIDNLMHLMCYACLSGELYLHAPDNSACFVIENGVLVFGHMKHTPLRIGERLLQKEHITKEVLEECLEIYRTREAPVKFGSLLVEKGYLSSADLENTIKEQVKDMFFDVLSWKKGTFSFSPREHPLNEDILLDARIDHLVLEGILQQDGGELED